MNNPLVSIIIPAYNSEKWIEQCLDSVVAQTYKNWEAIVVVSPSSDDTLQKAKWYEDPRIIVIEELSKTNVATARNNGVAHSVGSLLAFLDADDWWENDKIEKQLGYMKLHPQMMWSCHWLELNYPNGDVIVNKEHPGKCPWCGKTSTLMNMPVPGRGLILNVGCRHCFYRFDMVGEWFGAINMVTRIVGVKRMRWLIEMKKKIINI